MTTLTVKDAVTLVLAGFALVVSVLSYIRSGKALKASGSDLEVRLEQSTEPGDMFIVTAYNRGRGSVSVEALEVEGRRGRKVSTRPGQNPGNSMEVLAWGGHTFPHTLAGETSARWTLGPHGTYWVMSNEKDPQRIHAEALTRPVRVILHLGNGRPVKSPWVRYRWK